jgi:hypothetical protein
MPVPVPRAPGSWQPLAPGPWPLGPGPGPLALGLGPWPWPWRPVAVAPGPWPLGPGPGCRVQPGARRGGGVAAVLRHPGAGAVCGVCAVLVFGLLNGVGVGCFGRTTHHTQHTTHTRQLAPPVAEVAGRGASTTHHPPPRHPPLSLSLSSVSSAAATAVLIADPHLLSGVRAHAGPGRRSAFDSGKRCAMRKSVWFLGVGTHRLGLS